MGFQKNFSPWKKDALKGATWLGALAASVGAFAHWGAPSFGVGMGVIAATGAMAVYYLGRASRRRFGQVLERKASDTLEKVFGPENVRRNIPLPGAGDIDAALSWKSLQYNIEIKSMGSLEKITDKHIEQARKAARYLKTKPIVWLPNSTRTRKAKVQEVLVFQGSARALRSYISPFFGFRRF